MKPTQRILCAMALCLSTLGVTLAETLNSVPADALERLDREGTEALSGGEFQTSAKKFELLTTLAPESAEHSLKYGAALYFSEQYHACVHEFVRRDNLSPLDAENTLWHFLCTAKLEGVDVARRHMLPAEDARIPMADLIAGYAGQAPLSDARDAPYMAYESVSPEFMKAILCADTYVGLIRDLGAGEHFGDEAFVSPRWMVRGDEDPFLHRVAGAVAVRYQRAELRKALEPEFVLAHAGWSQRKTYGLAGLLLVGVTLMSLVARRRVQQSTWAPTLTGLAICWPLTLWAILVTWTHLDLVMVPYCGPFDMVQHWALITGDFAFLPGLFLVGGVSWVVHRRATGNKVQVPGLVALGLIIGVVTVIVDCLFIFYTTTPTYG